ncbi:hypothetical protein [Microtetraspora malaysiensis]
MPTQTIELPQFALPTDAEPSVVTDAPHERAWYPPYLAPRG